MRKKGFFKKALIYSLVGAIIAGNTIPALAYTNSVGKVNETQDITESQDAQCEVYAQLGTEFKVIIPKKITLSGSTKKGSYTVDVEGDIGGTDAIKVVPDPSVALSSPNLATITAPITQDKTSWSWSEIVTSNKVIGNGAIDAAGITAGSWNGSFNFNISLKENSSLITVEAKNESGENLNASASEIVGTQKDTLLDKLVDTGMINSADEVDALIEVKSDEFDGMAETTFNVSGIANEGDKVTILHYNEKTNEWEYISTETVNSEGTITADFSSYSPVAFVKVNEDGSYGNHEHIYASTITKESTCTEAGVKTFTCYCGDSYTESIPATGEHNYVNHTCTMCKSQEAGLYNASGKLLCTWEKSGIDITKTYSESTSDSTYYKTCKTSGYYVLTNKYPTTTKLVIPEGVKSIGWYVFRDCTNLKSITIPSSVISMGAHAFQNCSGEVIINCSIPSCGMIAGGAFYQCNFSKITLGSGVKYIGKHAFYQCKNLTSVTIPSSVTSIGEDAFYGCTGLKNVTIENGLKNIDFMAFAWCKNLTSINIPESVTYIERSAFYQSNNLSSVTFANTSGWYIGDTAGAKTKALSSSSLANKSTAATYLKDTYVGKYWTR